MGVTMRIVLALIVAVFLFGCVNPQIREIQDWSDTNKPLVESGQMKWSDYYKEIYSRFERLPSMAGKAENMEWFNLLIQAAQLYESGNLSKDQFENFRRTVQVQQEQAAQVQRAAAARAFGQAMQNFGNTVYGPEATRAQQFPVPAYQAPRQIDCQTYGNQTSCTQY